MNNIYMEYLTEDTREDIILEKEVDLINTDIYYLFTTYEAVDNDNKQGVLKRILEKIKKLIERLIEFINNKILKNKKSTKSNQNNKIMISSKDYKLYKDYEKLYKKECKFIDKIQKLTKNINLFGTKTLDELTKLNDELLKDLSNIKSTNYEDKQIICPEKDIHEKVIKLNNEVANTLEEIPKLTDSFIEIVSTYQLTINMKAAINYYDGGKNELDTKSIYSNIINVLHENVNSVVSPLIMGLVNLNL